MVKDNDTYVAELPPDVQAEHHEHRKRPHVANVKNQKRCDTCWTIASCDCVAIGKMITDPKKEFVELSCKEILDCGKEIQKSSKKCYMGSLNRAFRFMEKERAIRAEYYPFKPEKTPCSKRRKPEWEPRKVLIKGHEDLDWYDEIGLMRAVMEYSIVGAIKADEEFRNLKNGIYMGLEQKAAIEKAKTRGKEIEEPSEENAEKEKTEKVKDVKKDHKHAILIVDYSYDSIKDVRYWVIKSSYGKGWGDQGFGRIARQSGLEEDEDPLITRTSRPIF